MYKCKTKCLVNNNHSFTRCPSVGNHEERCVAKESVKAAELGACTMNTVAHTTINPQENIWPEGKHQFDASQATRGALY